MVNPPPCAPDLVRMVHRTFTGRRYTYTVAKQSTSARLGQSSVPIVRSMPENLRDDARWRLAQEVVAGPHFARSPLLSKFLLYVVAETLEGREASITEHKIGVAVFDRPASYRTEKDNIVRNYARQLRKRLAE